MLLMGNLHNYRGACQPRPCSPFRIGQVWRIWPATFDRCKNERTLHRAGAHAERGEQTKRETDRQPATAAAQLCGTVADAPAMWHAARTLNFSWNLNWLRVGHCHSWCHTVPACCQMQHSIGSRQHRHQWQAAFAFYRCHTMQLLIRNSPAGLACLLRALHTEKKQFVTHTHTHKRKLYYILLKYKAK